MLSDGPVTGDLKKEARGLGIQIVEYPRHNEWASSSILSSIVETDHEDRAIKADEWPTEIMEMLDCLAPGG